MVTFQQNLISQIFDQDPELAFLEQVGGQNLPRNLQRFFRGQTNNFLQQFQQSLAQQLSQGTIPGVNAGRDFFGGLDLQQEASKFSPSARGLGANQFNPRHRFFFN